MIDTLDFKNVSFAYDDQRAVFTDVDFAWPNESALWVRAAGEDRGRSTLLKLLAGLIEPTAGQILINGRAAGQMAFAERLRYRLGFGYGFDHGGLLSTASLADNLSLPLTYHGLRSEPEAASRVRDLLARFGLGDVADLRPHAVTGSQRKLTCVLRAFVHGPEMVALDEPLNGLNARSIAELIDYTREGFRHRGLKRLIVTGDNPALTDAVGAVPLNISRQRFWTGDAA